MANTLKLYRQGAVGFIGWLGLFVFKSRITVIAASAQSAEVRKEHE